MENLCPADGTRRAPCAKWKKGQKGGGCTWTWPNPQRARLRQLGAIPNSVATRRGVAALPLYPHWLFRRRRLFLLPPTPCLSVLSLFLENKKKNNKQSNQLIKTRRALGPELLRDYVREPCIGRVVVVVGQRSGAPNLITRRLRPALGESWIFHINRKKTLQFIFTSTFFFEDFTLDKFLFFKGNKLKF